MATKSASFPVPRPPRPTPTAASVTRKVDSSGNVSFAGTSYRAGNAYRRRQVQVAVVGDTVEISVGTQLIRAHRAHHEVDIFVPHDQAEARIAAAIAAGGHLVTDAHAPAWWTLADAEGNEVDVATWMGRD